MAEDALATKQGYEESVGVIHLSHFLLFNLLLDDVEAYGRAQGTQPRMIIVGSITHNPDELAGKIPPRADLGDCQGLARGFKVVLYKEPDRAAPAPKLSAAAASVSERAKYCFSANLKCFKDHPPELSSEFKMQFLVLFLPL